jgi:hypothetical protein
MVFPNSRGDLPTPTNKQRIATAILCVRNLRADLDQEGVCSALLAELNRELAGEIKKAGWKLPYFKGASYQTMCTMLRQEIEWLITDSQEARKVEA